MGSQGRWSDFQDRTWLKGLLLFVLIAPLVSGVVSRFLKGSHWFSDFEAVECAGQRLIQGLPIYDPAATCPGMKPSGFVYLPSIAEAFSGMSQALGADLWRLIYLGVFFLTFGYLLWACFVRREGPGDRWDRLLGLGLVTGSAPYWANIALPLHAGLCLAAWFAPRRPVVFTISLAIAGAIKPVFLTYGLVLLALPLPIWKRFALGAVAAAAGLAPTMMFLATGGGLAEEWSRSIDLFIYNVQPGDGFYGWIDVLGLSSLGLGPSLAWGLFALSLCGCVIVLAGSGGLQARERALLGLGVGALANPRITPNDTLLLAMLIGSLFALIRLSEMSEPRRRRLAGALALTCALGALGQSLDLGDYAPKVVTLVLTLTLFLLTAWYGMPARAGPPGSEICLPDPQQALSSRYGRQRPPADQRPVHPAQATNGADHRPSHPAHDRLI
jgi:hypothetical protein